MKHVFYGITMVSRNGKTLYLKCSERETKDPYKVLMDWSFNVNEACLWESYRDCRKFANSYFKNFDRFNINTITVDERNMQTHNEGVAA